MTLGRTIIQNDGFFAPERISDLAFLDGGRILALTSSNALVIDAESGRCLLEASLGEGARYDVRLKTSGSRAIAVPRGGGAVSLIEIGANAIERRTIAELGESAYETSAAITDQRIAIAESSRVQLFSADGTRAREVAGPLEGDARVCLSPRGTYAAFENAGEIACVHLESGREVRIAAEVVGELAFSADERLLAVPQLIDGYRWTIVLFDPESGEERGSASGLRTMHGDARLAFALDGHRLAAMIGTSLVSWSLADETLLWVTDGWGPNGGLAFHPGGDRIAVARGQRIMLVDAVRGTRIGGHPGPSQEVVEIARDRRGRVVARDAHRAYLFDDAGPAISREIDAWSCRLSDGDIYVYTHDGSLLRAGDGDLEPIGQPMLPSGRPTRVVVRGERILYPDPNQREPLHTAHRSGRGARAIGSGSPHEACFAGDRIAVANVSYDEANDYRMVQSIALWSGDGEVLWQKPIESDALIELSGASESLIAFELGNLVRVLGLDGEQIAELHAESPRVVILDDLVFVLSAEGAIHRIRASGAVEMIADVGAGATAFHLDRDGRGLVAFGCRSIREVELQLGEQRPEQAQGSRPRLLHRFGHRTEVIAFDLSPDGRFLATGSWVGDDYNRGGTLQIWDANSGRILNSLDPIEGGVSWPDYRRRLQWSPSGRTIAMAFNTNAVGTFLPFGEAPIPRMFAYTTDGWSRPPAFAWSNREDRIAISSWNERSKIPSCIAETSRRRIDETTARWFAKIVPEGVEFGDAARELRFSPDDKVLFAHNGGHGQAWAVDLASGRLRYQIQVHERIGWSACGRWLAHAGEGELEVCDATTGARISSTPFEGEAQLLVWSQRGSGLAVATEGEILFFDGPTLSGRCDAVLEPDGDFDAEPLVWSPDGARAAWISEGRLFVDRDPIVEISPVVKGLFWRAEEAIVCVGPNVFESVSPATREIRFSRDLSVPAELLPDQPSPLVIGGEDFGETFRLNPAFPLRRSDGSFEWGLAFETGQVVCPPELVGELDAALSDHVELQRFDDLASAAPHLPLPERIRSVLGTPAKEEPLPLGEMRATFADLTQLHWETVESMSPGWRTHSSEALHDVAVLHARRKEAGPAAENARRVPEPYQRAMALAECAGWLRDASLLAEAESAAAEVDEHARLFVNADLGSAHLVLGDRSAAEARFAIAEDEEQLKNESNVFQNYTHLAAAYLRAGDLERANRAIDRGPWDCGYLHLYLPKYICWAAAIGQVDHALAVANRCREEIGEVDFDILDAITTAMLKADRHAELLVWLAQDEQHSTDAHQGRVTADLIAKGRSAEVVAQLIEAARTSESPSGIAVKMNALSKLAPNAVAELLPRILETISDETHRGQVPAMAGDLAEAMARIGRGRDALILERGLHDPDEELALWCGLLRGGDDSVAAQALALARGDAPMRTRISRLARVASALGSAALFDEARALGAQLRGDDRRFELASLMATELEAQNLRGAYETWRKIPQHNRVYEISRLVETFARAGEIDAVIHLLRQLPKKDDMNGLPQELMRAIRIVAL